MVRISRRSLIGTAGAFAGGAALAAPRALSTANGLQLIEPTAPACDIAALREGVSAIISEFGGPLPAADAGLAEAKRRLYAISGRSRALYKVFDITFEIEAAEICPRLDPLENRYIDLLTETEPQTLAGAATILSYALDTRHGLLEEPGIQPVANVFALVKRLAAGGAA